MPCKELTVVLRRSRNAAVADDEDDDDQVTAVMAHVKKGFGPNFSTFIGAANGLKQFIPVQKKVCRLNDSGFWVETKTWKPVIVTADASKWWRVVPYFSFWSRQALVHEPNLLEIMPCELCWVSRRARAFFIAVYVALKALPREVVDTHVLSYLSCEDIVTM
jgi:hypothetical protein